MIGTTAYQRFHAATRRIRQESLWPKAVAPEAGSACDCCGRPFEDTEDPDQAIIYQYNASLAPMAMCTTCYTPKSGTYDALGVERMAGKTGNTVPAKLGMLPACGGVITTDNQLHMSMPPGFVRKFSEGSFYKDGLVYEMQPDQLFWTLYRDGALSDIDQGIVVIAPFGRKSLNLMQNLRLTRSLDEVWINSEDGVRASERASIPLIAEWAKEHDKQDEVCKPGFWKPIRDAALGRHDAKAFSAWAEKVPGAAELVQRLPEDPHDRLSLHLSMRAFIGE